MLDIIVEVVSVSGLPETCTMHTTGKTLRKATYTFTVFVDDKIMLTCDISPKEDGSKHGRVSEGSMNTKHDLEKSFGCKISKSSTLSIKVDCKHTRVHDPHSISRYESEVVDLLTGTERDIRLKYTRKSMKYYYMLKLKLSRVTSTAELNEFRLSIPKKCLYTVADLEGLGIISKVLNNEIRLSYPEWINLLGSVGTFFKVAEPIAEFDPRAKLVLSVVEVAFDMFIKQKERDDRVLGLVQIMGNLYQMILDSDPIQKCRTLTQSINDLIALTRECSYFIAQYEKSGHFGQRMVSHAISNTDDIITQFEKQFFILKEVFFTGIMLSIGHINVRTMKVLQDVDEKLDHLVDMIALPVLGRSWNRLEKCLNGTREELLSKIYEWGTSCNDDVPKIFLLHGDTGLGKTAVANSVAKLFSEEGRLGATIFFDSDDSSCRNFILSVIRELSAYDPLIRQKMMMCLRKNSKFVNDPLYLQMDFLNSEVFSDLTLVGPTIIVVDGLDKCTDRRNLLGQLSKFPSNIRFFITSQPFEDIINAFSVGSCLLHQLRTIDDAGRWDKLDLFVSGFLDILERSRRSIFTHHTREDVEHEIHLQSRGIYLLAQVILEIIAVTEEDVALKLLDVLFSTRRPEHAAEAQRNIKSILYSILENCKSSIGSSLLRNRARRLESIDESMKNLVDGQYISLVSNGTLDLKKFSIVLESEIINHLNLLCTRNHCNVAGVLFFLGDFDETRGFLAMQCILNCKCSYLPEVLREENKNIVKRLLKNDNCIPERVRDTELEIFWAIQTHHKVLNAYESHHHSVTTDSPTLILLTPPLQHSGISTFKDKITLVQFSLEGVVYMNVKVEAAIYRGKTQEATTKFFNSLENYINDLLANTTVPSIEDLNNNGIEVVKNPITGSSSWSLKVLKPQNDKRWQSTTVLSFNCPISAYSNDGAARRALVDENILTEDPWIGFANSLRPGDRIAVFVEGGYYSAMNARGYQLEVGITLYQDLDQDKWCFSDRTKKV